jgi:hypothetical protein
MRDCALLTQSCNEPGSIRTHRHGSRNFILSFAGKSYIYIYIYTHIFGLASVPAFFAPVSASAATTCYTETPTFALPELLILRLEPYLFECKNKATTCVAADSKCKLWTGSNGKRNDSNAFIPEYVKWPHFDMDFCIRPCIYFGSISCH